MTTDYKSSVFLPKTDFPMRAGLPKKEPELLKRWADMDLFHRLRSESKGRPKFVLHDGPRTPTATSISVMRSTRS